MTDWRRVFWLRARLTCLAARNDDIGGVEILGASDAESVGDAVDVVEEGCDEVDLQDRGVVESVRAQEIEVFSSHRFGLEGELRHVVEDGPIGGVQLGRGIVPLDGTRQLFVQGDSTQKLRVGFCSIEAAIERRDGGRDHLVPAPRERKVRLEQRAVKREGVVEGVGDETVGHDDPGAARRFVDLGGFDGDGIFGRVELLLFADGRDQSRIGFLNGYGLDPGHFVGPRG